MFEGAFLIYTFNDAILAKHITKGSYSYLLKPHTKNKVFKQ